MKSHKQIEFPRITAGVMFKFPITTSLYVRIANVLIGDDLNMSLDNLLDLTLCGIYDRNL